VCERLNLSHPCLAHCCWCGVRLLPLLSQPARLDALRAALSNRTLERQSSGSALSEAEPPPQPLARATMPIMPVKVQVFRWVVGAVCVCVCLLKSQSHNPLLWCTVLNTHRQCVTSHHPWPPGRECVSVVDVEVCAKMDTYETVDFIKMISLFCICICAYPPSCPSTG
jgi:hypothetical protein